MNMAQPSKPGDDRQHSSPPNAWAKAYALYRPLLFNALSRLARRGYVTPPDEGLDLIHDFFLEAWDGVNYAYDPAKSKFETYLYGSFVQFARPRIIRLRRWREGLVQPSDLAELAPSRLTVEATQEFQPDLAAIANAVSRLSDFDRNVLLAYLTDQASSERELAQRFSLTRYRLRMCVADAFGKMAVHLGDMGPIGGLLRSVLLALWRDGRTVKETAQLLEISIPEVQAMRTHLYKMVSDASHGGGGSSRSKGQGFGGMPDFLITVLRAEASPRSVEELRAKSAQIIAFMEDAAGEEFFAKHASDFKPESIAQLYAALGSDAVLDQEDQALLDSMLQASDAEEKDVGKAFWQVLLPSLPSKLRFFEEVVFRSAPRIDGPHYKALLSEPSVISGGPAAAELARFGVTPVTVLTASQGIANLARRFCTARAIPQMGTFSLQRSDRNTVSGRTSEHVLPRETSVEEVQMTSGTQPRTAACLFDWLSDVAETVPLVFDGFEAGLVGHDLRLRWTASSVDDLYKRWSSQPR
jgi:RNA polymerase sigma factor (sigma-70 family)